MTPPTSHHAPRSARIILVFLALALLLSAAWPATLAAQQASRRFVWDRVNTVVQLRMDGSLHVIERDQVRFFGKPPYQRGYRDIPWARIERIEKIQVSAVSGSDQRAFQYVSPQRFSLDVPYTYTYRTIGANLRIEWSFPPTSNASRTFQLEFDAFGVLRVYDDANSAVQQLNWLAVDRLLTASAPVNTATLTIILPQPIQPGDAYFEGPGGAQWQDHTQDGQSWTWAAHNLGRGDSLGVILGFPALVNAKKPAWQDSSDRRELGSSTQINPIALGLGLFILVAGSLIVLAVWWTWGRDPAAGPLPEFVTAPPGNLPPAVAGALVDEKVDERDIVATLVDLARRGVMQIATPQGDEWSASQADFTMTMMQSEELVSPFERALLSALFGNDLRPGQSATLATMGERFKQKGGHLRVVLYQELVQRGFFAVTPSRTRVLWQWVAVAIMLFAVVGAWMFSSISAAVFSTFWLPFLALALLAVLVRFVANSMPRKTVAGAEAAANYRAFKRYLERIDGFQDLSRAQEMFDRYLPYAIAFGLQGEWVDAFAKARTPSPTWFRGLHWSPAEHTGNFGSGSFESAMGNTGGTPSLQQMSTATGQSLQETSNSLFSWFNSASESFGGEPAPGNSGFSGSASGLRIGVAILRGMSGGGGGGFS